MSPKWMQNNEGKMLQLFREMPKEPQGEFKYKSRYGKRFCSATQYLAELIVSRRGFEMDDYWYCPKVSRQVRAFVELFSGGHLFELNIECLVATHYEDDDSLLRKVQQAVDAYRKS